MGEQWLDPTPEMLEDPLFEAIWQVIKSWDVNVPAAYDGYMGATGNHARAIYDAVRVGLVRPVVFVPSDGQLGRVRALLDNEPARAILTDEKEST